MNTIKWFDRVFDFNFGVDCYPQLYDRLESAPARFAGLLSGMSEALLIAKPDNKWSVKEHIGHLAVLEPLWRQRILDIRDARPVLTPADLNNELTSAGDFNNWDINRLLPYFAEERQQTLDLLNSLPIDRIQFLSLHPRLQQPMRMIDHLYFIAEHDDHHFHYTTEFKNQR